MIKKRRHERGGRFPRYRLVLKCKERRPFVFNSDVNEIETLNLIFPFPVTIIRMTRN